MRKIFALLILAILFACTKAPDMATNDYCDANKDYFLQERPEFFKDTDFDAWCMQCTDRNGAIAISHDADPYCNLRTMDAGKPCTDSSQCQGYCIADSNTTGKCTEFEQLGDGCGLQEMVNGEIAELCVS